MYLQQNLHTAPLSLQKSKHIEDQPSSRQLKIILTNAWKASHNQSESYDVQNNQGQKEYKEHF